MKKRVIILLLALEVMLCGCGKQENSGDSDGTVLSVMGGREDESETLSDAKNASGEETSAEEIENVGGAGGIAGISGERTECAENEADDFDKTNGGMSGSTPKDGDQDALGGIKVVQSGPYGAISVMLPTGWHYELCPIDSDSLISGEYGIQFSPDEAAEGFIELAYVDWFGVCGTGLDEEDAVIAGEKASVGTYDGNDYWNFIKFTGQKEHIVALSYGVEDWWETYGEAVMGILDTLCFDPDTREGSAYVYTKESEDEDIGLYLSLKNISATGATLVYDQYDGRLPSGELEDGDDFIMERYQDGDWEEVPVVVEGEYGFHAIAYTISKDATTERVLDWAWLYGELPPGEYRIGKAVQDFRKTNDFDSYMLYASFIIN